MATEELWVDSNIVVRFITKDPPEQAQRVLRLMERARAGAVTIKLCAMIVAECCWVLESVYGFRAPEVSRTLGNLIRADGVRAEEREVLLEALDLHAEQNVDLVDAYLAAHARYVGPSRVCTFNTKDFRRLGVTHLLPDAEDQPTDGPQRPSL